MIIVLASIGMVNFLVTPPQCNMYSGKQRKKASCGHCVKRRVSHTVKAYFCFGDRDKPECIQFRTAVTAHCSLHVFAPVCLSDSVFQ